MTTKLESETLEPKAGEPKAGGRTRPVPQLPEPSRFWIGSAPRTWRATARWWTNAGNTTLDGLRKPSSEGVPGLALEDVDDLFYVPPVDEEWLEARDELVQALCDHGLPALVQVSPGDPLPPRVQPNDEGESKSRSKSKSKSKSKSEKGESSKAESREESEKAEGEEEEESEVAPEAHAIVLYDLLRPILDNEVDTLVSLPAGAVTVWPLIPGISDDPARWEEALEILALAKVSVVQPLPLELSPAARRKLAEGRPEEVFDALFHGRRPGRGERDLAEAVHAAGLSPFFDRPATPAVSARQRANREVSARLALAGDLWLRLGKSVAAGQAYFRAARGAESTGHDLRALARENNLKVLDWLDDRALRLAEEWLEKGESTRLERLKAEYLGDPVPDDEDDD